MHLSFSHREMLMKIAGGGAGSAGEGESAGGGETLGFRYFPEGITKENPPEAVFSGFLYFLKELQREIRRRRKSFNIRISP